MKALVFNTLDLLLAILFLPIIVRDYLHAKSALARSEEILTNVKVAKILWDTGTDYRPLARAIYARIYSAYGVAPSKIAPGQLVELPKR